MAEAALKITGLTKKYKSITALDNVSLSMYDKRIYVLLGDKDSGKTTLFRCIAGLCKPDEGEIEILGNPYKDLTLARREVGMIVDQPVYFGDLNILNNLKMQARIIGGVDKERIKKVMKALKITPRNTGSRTIGGCPAGLKQSLAVALALLGAPRFLLMDEMFSGLDNDSSELVQKFILQEMGEHSMSVLISGQFFNELYPLATDFIFMDKGKIILTKTRQEIDEILPKDIKKTSEYETFYKELLKEAKV
jgi:ABC-2 type transport system ATP-binding protein